MVDPESDPWSSEPLPSPAGEDAPLDVPSTPFFEEDEGADLAELAGESEEPATFVGESKAPEPPAPAPPVSDAEPRHPAFPILLGAALVVVLVIAIMGNPQPVAAPSGAPATTPAPATAEATAPAPAAAEAGDVSALKSGLEALTAQVKEIQGHVDALGKPGTTPALAPIEARVAELSKASEATAALPKQLGDLDTRVGSVDKALAALKDEVAALKDAIAKAPKGTAAAPSSTSPTTPEASTPAVGGSADEAVAQGADLFKGGKYREANDLFHKLSESYPDDARVWYYAAMSQGLATNQWQGDTLRLVSKGVEREKAGTPEAAKINTAFAALAPPSVKNWLDYYRKTAQK